MKKLENNDRSFKLFIMEALLMLLQERKFSDITIKEIIKKAGVNRSTYYRNFNSKEEIIEYFYCYILTKCVTTNTTKNTEDHLLTIFHQFLNYKVQLLCLHKNKLSYLLLDVLNSFFTDNGNFHTKVDFDQEFKIHYHTGGIFNTFLLWFEFDMCPSPEQLVNNSIKTLPTNFTPFL